jgi:hypothetical protein
MPKEVNAPGALDHLPLVFTKHGLPPREQLTGLLKQQMTLADEENDYQNMELFAVSDAAGRHLFDALIHVGDDGYVFSPGTTDWVAIFAQGGADGHDAGLCEALDEAFERYKASV